MIISYIHKKRARGKISWLDMCHDMNYNSWLLWGGEARRMIIISKERVHNQSIITFSIQYIIFLFWERGSPHFTFISNIVTINYIIAKSELLQIIEFSQPQTTIQILSSFSWKQISIQPFLTMIDPTPDRSNPIDHKSLRHNHNGGDCHHLNQSKLFFFLNTTL